MRLIRDVLNLTILQIPILSTPLSRNTFPYMTGLSVLRANEIREGLGLLDAVTMAMVIVMAVVVRVSLRANILHLQDVSAFWAALDGTIAGHLD